MAEGFIKLYRKFMEWEWYHDTNAKILFLHCLLRANHKDNKWCGKVIEKGSFVTSYNNLSKELGLSVQQVRSSINRLKSTSEITTKTTNKYTIIYVEKWGNYQSTDNESNKQINKQTNKRATNKQQTNNKQITTNKNVKNVKNEKNVKKKDIKKHVYGEYSHVRLTDEELEKLKEKHPDFKERIRRLDEYIEMKGASYKNHYLTILNWARRDKEQTPKTNDVKIDWLDDYIEKMK